MSQLEKRVTVRKMCHSLKKVQLSLKRWLRVRKMCHSYKNVHVKVMKPNSPLNNDSKLFLYVELTLTQKIAQTKYILSIKICNHIREWISVSNNFDCLRTGHPFFWNFVNDLQILHTYQTTVFLSRNYRLIVVPQKFDVLKHIICPRSKASRANMLVSRQKHSNVFIVQR